MFVSNLGFHLSDENLKSLFAPFGEVSSAKVVTDRVTGRSRGFGFVVMPQDDEAGVALLKLEGSEIGGRRISVTKAKPRSNEDHSTKTNNSPWK